MKSWFRIYYRNCDLAQYVRDIIRWKHAYNWQVTQKGRDICLANLIGFSSK